MFDVKRFLEKFNEVVPIDNIQSILEKLKEPELHLISENAGTIGGIIKIILHIADKIYTAKVPVYTRLSFILMRILLESANDSLPYSVSKTNLKDIISEKENGFDVDGFGNIILELFDSKYDLDTDDNQKNTDFKISAYLPDHPVFIKFKELLKEKINTINSNHGCEFINSSLFLTEFNSNVIIKLEEAKGNDKDIQNLLHKWQVHQDFEKLKFYLKNARDVYFEKNLIDGKSLSEYYIDNNAYRVHKDTWRIDEKKIMEEEKEKWDYESFLKSPNNFIEVIAASYGIGKSSLARKISFDCANKFIENPTDPTAYIPIFVQLKFALEVTCNGNRSLENDLNTIALHSSRKKETNILVILDGLDELASNKPINNQTIYKTIQQEFLKNFSNSKYIITTRQEEDFPEKLNIKDHYIRLFSFNDYQIKLFFINYSLQDKSRLNNIPTNIYEKMPSILSNEKLGKPLFCWMLATVYNSSPEPERESLFNYSKDNCLAEVLLYQRFIHEVIMGKPNDVAKTDYTTWFEKKREEKKALRLLAFIKTDNPSIPKNLVEYYLDSSKCAIPVTSKSLLSTYFSFNRTDSGTEEIEFIHKSFQEYLLAEFYLESIFHRKYYRLVGKEPTIETYKYINALIQFINSKDQKIKELANIFVKTFYDDDENKIESKLDNFINTLIINSMDFAKQKHLIPDIPNEDNVIWKTSKLEYNDLNKIWLSRWISIFIAGNCLSHYKDKIKDEFVESSSFFIKNESFLISNKILTSVCLKKGPLSAANLSGANLRKATILEADLSGADLLGSNLSEADLSSANLSESDLSAANLSAANLSAANLSKTNLSGADLSAANLSEATVSFSILRDIERFENLKLDNTKFYNALTNMTELVEFIRIYPRENPNISITSMDNKQLFEEELKNGGYDDEYINQILTEPLWIISSDTRSFA